MLRVIGNDQNLPRQEHVVASGTLPSGKPVIINADGTVSVVAETAISQAVGTAAVFETGHAQFMGSTFDSNSNKVVIAYKDTGNSNYGTAVVGTVSGSSISFGTPVVFYSTYGTAHFTASFDSSNNKVVIVFYQTNNDYGLAIVGTVSGTSISFGSVVGFSGSNQVSYPRSTFDSSNNKIVIAYGDASSNTGKAIVGTVSGTSISFGSAVTFENASSPYTAIAFDSSNNKVVIAYQDNPNSEYGTAIVGTVSGTSISFGSAAVFESAEAVQISIGYDANAQKVVIAYQDGGNSQYGTAVVGTVSGTSISFGSPVVFESAVTFYTSVAYHADANKIIISYQDQNNSNYGTLVVGTVSGTSISFGSAVVFESAEIAYTSSVYDSNSKKVVISYRDSGNSSQGTALTFEPAYTSQNLTSENYIGISRSGAASGAGAIIDTQGAIADNLSGLTAGQSYFVQTDGTLGTTAASPSVFAGTAVSATKLIVKG
tara:strand:+ start:2495 stop:3952 length:1458 start_codon:yes stop_codon:yes gene_type:complete